jgi:hypothetical protein
MADRNASAGELWAGMKVFRASRWHEFYFNQGKNLIGGRTMKDV